MGPFFLSNGYTFAPGALYGVPGGEGTYFAPTPGVCPYGVKLYSEAGLTNEPNLAGKIASWVTLGKLESVMQVYAPVTDGAGQVVGAEVEHVPSSLALSEFSSPARRPAVADAARVAELLFIALVALHVRGVRPRDLNRDNIRLRETDLFPTVIDIISSQLHGKENGRPVVFPAPVVDPAFAAPELQDVNDLAAVPATTEADVFALTLCVSSLFLSRSPFAVKDSRGRILPVPKAIKLGQSCFDFQAPFTPVIEAAELNRLPQGLRDALSAGLSSKASDRPSAADLAETFGKFAASPAVPVAVPTPLPPVLSRKLPFPMRWRPLPWLIMAGSGLAASVAALVLLATARERGGPPAAPSPPLAVAPALAPRRETSPPALKQHPLPAAKHERWAAEPSRKPQKLRPTSLLEKNRERIEELKRRTQPPP